MLIEHSCRSLNINWQLISPHTPSSSLQTGAKYIFKAGSKRKKVNHLPLHKEASVPALPLLPLSLFLLLCPPFSPLIWFSAFISASFSLSCPSRDGKQGRTREMSQQREREREAAVEGRDRSSSDGTIFIYLFTCELIRCVFLYLKLTQ